jgi:ribosomal protein S18 acetylase RimI-like enzyme
MISLLIRALESRDIESVLAIQSACPEIAQWTAGDYERVAQGEMAGWINANSAAGRHSANPDVGRDQRSGEGSLLDLNRLSDVSDVNGFLVARRVASDIEILNFAVHPDERGRGAGTALLNSALDWARSFSAEQAILEVRSANQTALRFYEHHKFQVVGRRRNYYTSPADDALLLTAHIA